MTKLKTCPFCGSDRVGVFNTIIDPVTKGVHFDEPTAICLCFSCAAAAGFIKIKNGVTIEEAEEKAIDYWNMRAVDLGEEAEWDGEL